MRKQLIIAAVSLVSANSAFAGSVGVPEIDAAGAFIALAVVVSVVALIKEKFTK